MSPDCIICSKPVATMKDLEGGVCKRCVERLEEMAVKK
jgi:DNA-directed RNA polymerase subunit RPC12/RpoP